MPRHLHSRAEDSVRYWPTSSVTRYVPVVDLAQISDADWRHLTQAQEDQPSCSNGTDSTDT